ncbi:hypothetical protein HaLaN_02776 [Haematococcus lacustris]|uniref:Uncharacterized protein n=1 Tax=Haematococcus lacustris TaxID=44745 RepID=A0A699YEP3_HAELA|nr:hypothetical protein HaLaN_02776 [Haematococcus lacustris]
MAGPPSAAVQSLAMLRCGSQSLTAELACGAHPPTPPYPAAGFSATLHHAASTTLSAQPSRVAVSAVPKRTASCPDCTLVARP